jgi:glycosyl transferase family 25
MDSFFDKIYIINMKESVDRKTYMTEQMNKFNIKNYVFQNAVVGKDLLVDSLKEQKLWAYPGNDFCETSCSCLGNGHDLTKNQIGLQLSHYSIWEDMLKNNYKKCLIFEDDVTLTDENKNFQDIVRELPDDWEFIYYGHSEKINNENSIDINNLYFKKLISGVNETHMYAITNDAAKILFENTYPVRAAIDGYISHFIINKGFLSNVYICKLMLGINGSLCGLFESIGS